MTCRFGRVRPAAVRGRRRSVSDPLRSRPRRGDGADVEHPCGTLVAARGGADDVDLVVDVEVADEVDALGRRSWRP